MNIVEISGSVGEQMFQYAFFMRLLKKHPDTLINTPKDWIEKMFPGIQQKPIATAQEIRAVHKSVKNAIIGLCSGTKRTGNDYQEKDNSYKSDILDLKDTYFSGKWLSYRYFDNIAQEVAKTFTISPKKPTENIQNIIEILDKEPESVSIHIHRPTSKQNTCTKDYYNWAIAHIRQFIDNPFFVIMTDDEKWVRENLLLDEKEHICIKAKADDHRYNIIQLFNHAKHNIIANTLESWWVAWLNPNPDKIVIAPKKWSHTESYPDLIPIYWITIPTT